MKVQTGIKGLDSIIGGGFPENSTLLLIGPPGSGKTTFCQQFIYEGLRKTEPAIYITLDSSPEDINKSMLQYKWDPKPFIKQKKFYFLDAYSWKVGGAEEKEWKKVIRGGLDINALNLTFSSILEKANKTSKRGVFDSLSTLLLYVPSELVVRFVPVLVAKAKKSNATQILILEEGVHDEKTIKTLSYVADGVMEIKLDGEKRALRVTKMNGADFKKDWHSLESSREGLSLKA
jgi:KaiC/GvpD/RAD55 family RecA-like ATPase